MGRNSAKAKPKTKPRNITQGDRRFEIIKIYNETDPDTAIEENDPNTAFGPKHSLENTSNSGEYDIEISSPDFEQGFIIELVDLCTSLEGLHPENANLVSVVNELREESKQRVGTFCAITKSLLDAIIVVARKMARVAIKFKSTREEVAEHRQSKIESRRKHKVTTCENSLMTMSPIDVSTDLVSVATNTDQSINFMQVGVTQTWDNGYYSKLSEDSRHARQPTDHAPKTNVVKKQAGKSIKEGRNDIFVQSKNWYPNNQRPDNRSLHHRTHSHNRNEILDHKWSYFKIIGVKTDTIEECSAKLKASIPSMRKVKVLSIYNVYGNHDTYANARIACPPDVLKHLSRARG